MSRTFRNPILPGFYPDPSICRAGDDYYLVTSSFEYFPGLPIFHSRDLVNWRQIGHVLSRPSQLDLDGIPPSGGLWAPTIRYHQGVFYVVVTFWEGTRERGSFLVTTTDIGGEWSEPYWLAEATGIDPSLFFDDDGRVWYTANRPMPDGKLGEQEIWLQELDLPTKKLIGPRYSLWAGALRGALWTEAPHLYKIGGFYYLMTAEGGTAHAHAVTIARSEKITGPYEGCPHNPILTHRHLGLDYPIVGTGHADLVETQNGKWWLVLLAMRPYDGYYYNLGRETFLAPVRWEAGWPIVNPGFGCVTLETPAPDLPEHRWPPRPACDHFDAPQPAFCWNFMRTPRDDFWSLTERPGWLRLRLRPQTVMEVTNPSFVGRRQQHIDFTTRTVMEFEPRAAEECAGLVLLQNPDFHFRFVAGRAGAETAISLIKREKGEEQILGRRPIRPGRIYLMVTARGQSYSFYVAAEPEDWLAVAETVDGRILSTPVAGGFVGAYLGLYASSNGRPSANYADWDWFEYVGYTG